MACPYFFLGMALLLAIALLSARWFVDADPKKDRQGRLKIVGDRPARTDHPSFW